MKKLIVNADDFGFSAHTVEWTIRGFEKGVLTSATIMANMPETTAAVAYAKAHPQFSFGVHLYFSDELPVAEGPSTMVDPKTGHLWLTQQFMIRSFLGLIRVEDVKREIRAQYNTLKSTGLKISHIDGHGHMHRWPISIRALAGLKTELGLKVARRCQDIYAVPSSWIGRKINGRQQPRLARHFKTPDHFLMAAGKVSDAQADWFNVALKTLPEGITEIGIHPGIDTLWRRLDTEGPFATYIPTEIMTNFHVLKGN